MTVATMVVATVEHYPELYLLIMFILGVAVAFFGILALVTILRTWRGDDGATR